MLLKTPIQRTFRIYRRDDGRFVTRNESLTENPLRVDLSLNMTLGTAHHEAIATSLEEGCVVVVEVQQADGNWKRHNVVRPPKHSNVSTSERPEENQEKARGP